MKINKDKLVYAFLLIAALFFIAIEYKGISEVQPGDENAYFYMAKLVSEGKTPYRDFFYAHPPLHVYMLGLFYKVFGFKAAIFKSISIFSALSTAFLVFLIARRRFGTKEALASFAIYLFSYSIIFNSAFSFGIEFATMLLILGLYFLLNRNQHALGGILFGLASMTRLLAVIPALVVIGILIFPSRKEEKYKEWLKLLLGFLGTLTLLTGLMLMASGSEYINQAFKFHALKRYSAGENFQEYFDLIFLNWLLFASAGLHVFSRKKGSSMLFFVALAYLVFLFALKKIFGFYFLVILPFLALAGGQSLVAAYESIPKKFIKMGFLILVLSAFMWNLAADVWFIEQTGFAGFGRKEDLAQFTKSDTYKNSELFGDDSTVPLLALLTQKKIANDFVDTNVQVFLTGARDLNASLGDLKGKNILFVLRSKQGISGLPEVRDYVEKGCSFAASFHDKSEGDFLFYKCD